MVFVSGIPLTTLWIALTLVLYVVVVAIGLFGYTPTLRRQIELAEPRPSVRRVPGSFQARKDSGHSACGAGSGYCVFDGG